MEGEHDEDPSSSSGSLKIPKLKDEDFQEEDESNVREEDKIIFFAKQKKEHICCECGKEFSSGKALGGHMSSAHVQANQRLEESWKKKKIFQENSTKLMKKSRIQEEGFLNNNELMNSKNIICDICGKNFPSKKSLFGHMRCHPDRDWRGMKPPTTSKKNTKNKVFSEGDDRFAIIRDLEDIDVVVVPPLRGDCLKSWGVTDRRGRPPLTKKNKFISSSDERELHDAVHQLIRLVNGNNNNNNNNNDSEVICSSNSVGTTSKEAPLISLKDKSKKRINRGEICSSPVNKKRKQTIKLDVNNTPEVKYICNICHKSFTSHQALGGHRSSHNKFKITIENTIDKEIKARNQEDINHDLDINNIHKCRICDKIFPTGQALGGHQRSHWTNNQDESSSQNASKVLDFDLNELPDVDDCYR